MSGLALGRARVLVVAALITVLFACTCPSVVDAYSRVLRKGMTGEDVVLLQDGLASLGIYTGECDGVFGDGTLRAVEDFQRAQGLRADGVVGASTWERLEAELGKERGRTYSVTQGDSLWAIARQFGVEVEDIVRVNDIRDPSSIAVGQELRIPGAGNVPSRGGRGPIEVLHWDDVKSLFRSYATVVDVRTGLSFRVRRRGGHLHADAEPATSKDTAVMKKVYGGRWSWDRRPVVVEVAGRRVAASMNGMPHGGEAVRDNGFPGHFCIHFSGSKLHSSGEADPEHQACVREAAASE
ncbi:MAG: peptidoglycan-binding protein [Clostridia bacterium]